MSKEDSAVLKEKLEDMEVELEQLAKQNAMLSRNQNDLIKENNALQQAVQGNRKLIFQKMLDIKKDLAAIGKDKAFEINGRLQYNFRGIDDVINALFPLLNKHEVGIRSKVLQNAEEYKVNDRDKIVKNTRVIMEYIFFAVDGSELSCQMPAEGTDTSDKGTNKALSAAFKYCMFQNFCIPTEDVLDADFERESVGSGAKTESKVESLDSLEEAPKVAAKAPSEVKSKPASTAKKPASSFRKKKVSTKAKTSGAELEEL